MNSHGIRKKHLMREAWHSKDTAVILPFKRPGLTWPIKDNIHISPHKNWELTMLLHTIVSNKVTESDTDSRQTDQDIGWRVTQSVASQSQPSNADGQRTSCDCSIHLKLCSVAMILFRNWNKISATINYIPKISPSSHNIPGMGILKLINMYRHIFV